MIRNEIFEGDAVGRLFEILQLKRVDEVTRGSVTNARVPHSRSVTTEIRHLPAERVRHKGSGNWRPSCPSGPFHNAQEARGGKFGCGEEAGALRRLIG